MTSLCDPNLPHEVRDALFGGLGSVRVWNLAPAPVAPFAAVLACELDPGASVGPHVQERCAELVIGISGEGSVEVNGETKRLASGSVIDLPLGYTLSISNEISEEPLRYLILKATV
jgi:quercetin dioxygenase-like cupin family protein